MINFWIRTHWCVDVYVAEPGYDAYDGYDTYMNLGVGLSWTWSW